MRKRLVCKIESLVDKRETFWHVSINVENIPDAVTLLTALRFGKLDSLVLIDAQEKQETQMQIGYDLKKRIYTIEYKGVAVETTDTWVDAVLSLLTGTWVVGWSHLAHIDQEFSCSDGVVTICVSILPPAGDS